MSDTSAAPIIDITDMHKWFGSFHVLKNINLTVAARERIVICGPSGSRQVDLDPMHQLSRKASARPDHR